uniref:hypothetical protein n=1 Tax=Klebsiella pneumoniae TaxID=573 RepID=UPI001953905A
HGALPKMDVFAWVRCTGGQFALVMMRPRCRAWQCEKVVCGGIFLVFGIMQPKWSYFGCDISRFF